MTINAAKWGPMLIASSLISTLLMVGVAVITSRNPLVGPFIPILVLTPLAALFFIVRSFRVSPTGIHVQRLVWSTFLPLQNPVEFSIRTSLPAGSIRAFGNGGMFSFTGYFWSQRLGRFRVFATDFKRSVLIKSGGATFLLTPDDPVQLVQELKKHFEWRDLVE
jgi:hypothetical protein